jgi:hypothetical protein
MGLDQYAMAVYPHKENTDFDYVWTSDDLDKVTDLAQWRKHADLQGYMEELFYAKKEKAGEFLEGDWKTFKRDWKTFNCQAVRLSFQDLQDLEEAVNLENLPHTTGFFFGESHPDDKKDTLKFIVKARKAIAQDMEIYYYSWW